MFVRIAAAACFSLLPFAQTPAEEVPAALAEVLAKVFVGAVPEAVPSAELDGFYEVVFGQNIFYFSADGRYALRGDLYDVAENRNLTEERRGRARLDTLGRLGEESMIVFAPSEAKHTVTVFTDVDCSYCAKLHRQMADYNRRGIAIRYVAFPRAGIGSPTYDKMVSVWCADDPHQAIGDAKFGRPVPERTCDNLVSAQYVAGQEIGVRGTPAILLQSGELLGGYLSPDDLLTHLETDADGA